MKSYNGRTCPLHTQSIHGKRCVLCKKEVLDRKQYVATKLLSNPNDYQFLTVKQTLKLLCDMIDDQIFF